MTAKVSEMWMNFCEKEGIDVSTYYDIWHFCDTRVLADELAELVLNGVKCGTSTLSFLIDYYGEEPGKVGNHIIITDFAGNARCVIRIEEVLYIPFNEVDEKLAKIEGEGDGSLEYWRNAHSSIFKRWMEDIGHKFTNDLEVEFQIFKVVYK